MSTAASTPPASKSRRSRPRRNVDAEGFTPAYGPADEKVVWTIVGTTVERNGDVAFELAAITAARIEPAASRWDFHTFTVTAEGKDYTFGTPPGQTVDTDGWQWFVVTLLRRAQATTPDLRIDVRRLGPDSAMFVVGVLFIAIGLASAGLWAVSGTDEPEAAVVARALILIGFLVGGFVMVLKESPGRASKSLASPDEAADLVVPHFRRRYRS